MAKFTKLNTVGGEPVYINPEHVVTVVGNPDDGARLWTVGMTSASQQRGSGGIFIDVVESVVDVIAALESPSWRVYEPSVTIL